MSSYLDFGDASNSIVLIGHISWTAVVEGAMIKGLMKYAVMPKYADISERMARQHYGIHITVPYDYDDHGEEVEPYVHPFLAREFS